MKKTRLITTAKRFLGPIMCLVFCWLFLRWAAGIVAIAKLWPWCDCSPPPPQTYVLAVIGGISFGIAPLWFFGCFIHLGWQWFNATEARK